VACDDGWTLDTAATFCQPGLYSPLGFAADCQLLKLLGEGTGVRFRRGCRKGGALGGWSVLDHLHRAVNLVEAFGHQAGRWHLAEGNQLADCIVEPLGQAFGPADGDDAGIRIVKVVSHNAIELGLDVAEDEVRHVNPCDGGGDFRARAADGAPAGGV
jgi:hypothetical protein